MARKPKKSDNFGLLFGAVFSLVGIGMFVGFGYIWGGQYLVCNGKVAITCDLEIRRWFASEVVDRKRYTGIQKVYKGKMVSTSTSSRSSNSSSPTSRLPSSKSSQIGYSMSHELSEEGRMLHGTETKIDDAIERVRAHIKSGENRITAIKILDIPLAVYMSIFGSVFSLAGFSVLWFSIAARMTKVERE